MASIHFIAQLESNSNFRHRGVRPLRKRGPDIYTSGWWLLTKEEALFLKTKKAKIYLHETKNMPSYTGGTIVGYKFMLLNEETRQKLYALGHRDIIAPANELRVELRFRSEEECHGVPWGPISHPMAYTTGIIREATDEV